MEHNEDVADSGTASTKFSEAKNSLYAIEDRIIVLNRSSELDVDELRQLFDAIKRAQSRGEFDCLREQAAGALSSLSGRLKSLLIRFSNELKSEKSQIAGFNGADIHTMFNGFSTIVGESANESLLSGADFNKLRDPLKKLLTNFSPMQSRRKYSRRAGTILSRKAQRSRISLIRSRIVCRREFFNWAMAVFNPSSINYVSRLKTFRMKIY